ncbi:MAG: methylated-DNA--[protein]-cysteine S-methyltransferase [bacterium]
MNTDKHRYIHIWENTFGWSGLMYSPRGAKVFTFGEASRGKAENYLMKFVASEQQVIKESRIQSRLAGEIREIDDYFSGNTVKFNIPFDLAEYSSFYRRVWSVVAGIPYGKTASYGEIARRVGVPGGARAVGMAMAANPLPVLVPCHRVVRSDGSLGGYSRGLRWKKRLLELEKK